MFYHNPTNLYHNRYFTQNEKEVILYLHYEENLDEVQIAEILHSLPNHITWCLLRWKCRNK